MFDRRSYLIGSCLYESQGSDENYLHSIGGSDIKTAADPLLASTDSIGNISNVTAGESGQGQTDLDIGKTCPGLYEMATRRG